jgi:hypothetical protein
MRPYPPDGPLPDVPPVPPMPTSIMTGMTTTMQENEGSAFYGKQNKGGARKRSPVKKMMQE